MRRELKVFILLSLVSLFADMTYEGARGVLGPYTELLGGTALVAGGLALGDLVGYLTRATSGGLVHRVRNPRLYWGLVFLGYTINLGAVPLLALAGRWEEAFALVVAERVGKGLRAPARDVILAEVTEGLGRERGFALHEVMDQVGAVAGPLIVALAASGYGVRPALALLAVPAAVSIALLVSAFALYPVPRGASKATVRRGVGLGEHLTIAGIGLSLMILPVWPVLTYGVSPERASALYGLAMGVDAVVALVIAVVGSRISGYTAVIAVPLTALIGGLVAVGALSYGGGLLFMLAAAGWGVFMGVFEVYSRSSVAWLVGVGGRGLSYGLLGLYSAVGLASGGLVWGFLVYKGALGFWIPLILFLVPISLIACGVYVRRRPLG